MQKICIAIVFALALSSVVADYTPNNDGWAKTPVSACEDSLLNCTNTTVLSLGGLTTSDVNVLGYNNPVPVDAKNTSSSNWGLWTKVVDTKALASTSNTSYGFKAPQRAQIASGYVIGFEVVNDTNNVPQIWLYQTKIVGGTEIPRVAISSNTNANYTPTSVGFASNGKTLFFFYTVSDSKINFTSVALGASTVGKEFTLTTTFNSSTGRLGAVYGEALSTSQVYAGWTEGDAYKVAVVDFSSGTLVGSASLGNYNKNYTCQPYSTDKKYYGVYCRYTNNGTTDVYVSANTTSLLKLFSANATTQSVTGFFPYAGYLGFFYRDGTTANATVLSHDIWDVEGFKTFKNRTNYLTIDPQTSSQVQYRVPTGGIYSLLWNSAKDANSTKTKVQVGLLLEGSYLTTIFGSLMTIIAGLLLF